MEIEGGNPFFYRYRNNFYQYLESFDIVISTLTFFGGGGGEGKSFDLKLGYRANIVDE
jgi:hypothetical protein